MKFREFIFLVSILLISVLFLSCQSEQRSGHTTPSDNKQTALNSPPAWAMDAIWYQIFPERFRNGDPDNDPTPEDMTGSFPGFIPDSWKITPWTHDWYKPDPYFDEVYGKKDMAGYTIENFGQASRLRRYGGDLQGVLDKIDYLQELGVNAIYFNPLNDAPSEHKYDVRNWRHIDRNFGPNPKKDKQITETEDPVDPSSWKWTSADSLFLEVIDAFHQRGMRVIMDYSFNHTGLEFWAWKDILKNQEQSEFRDWYWIESFDKPGTRENEFEYKGWMGVKDLPEIRETEHPDHSRKLSAFEGDIKNPVAKEHLMNVVLRWLDPNSDGDPSDGVDGFRLDVAVELPLGFWRDFRKKVRSINPEAYLVGEVWWEQWPDKLMDPAPFLKGDIFDAVMHYRWYRPTRRFFTLGRDQYPVEQYIRDLQELENGIRPANTRVMMNVAASHDSPRLSTSLFNSETKYKQGTEPTSNPDYKLHRPGPETRQNQMMLLAQQFTYPGAPHIWAGDEMGMWGADMGDSRKPLIWPDYSFEDEQVHPLGSSRPVDEVIFDKSLFEYYKKLIAIRKHHLVLSHGNIDFLQLPEHMDVLTYSRYDEKQEIIAVFNTGNREKSLHLPIRYEGNYKDLLDDRVLMTQDDQIKINIKARSSSILSSLQ